MLILMFSFTFQYLDLENLIKASGDFLLNKIEHLFYFIEVEQVYKPNKTQKLVTKSVTTESKKHSKKI